MNILHLKYAVEIEKSKSISKAAQKLYMGQPNLSRAIRELEENLGITIFKRTYKGITVTPDGEEFLHYARRIIAQIEEVEEIYKNGKKYKQHFSVCVPRASYISWAFVEFTKKIQTGTSSEIFYKETDSMHSLNGVIKEEFNLGIIRCQSTFDKYFKSIIVKNNLMWEFISEFSYVLVMSKNHPLANKKKIELSSLSDYIEITNIDSYGSSLYGMDTKKAELAEYVDKRFFVFERSSQFLMLENIPNVFMWVSPVPKHLLEKYNLVQKVCNSNKKTYMDVLIYRKDYKLTELDNQFISEVFAVKREYL